jgi:mannan endo-1,4-beta-mannosidase
MTEGARPDRQRRGNRLGVFPGDDYDLANVRAIDEWLDGALDVVVTFVQADLSPARRESFVDRVLTPVWQAGYTPLLTWEPCSLALDTDASPAEQLRAEGLLRQWAETLAEWVGSSTGDQRALHFRPAHEPNGWWYPWSAGAGVTGRQYVEFWHALVDAFEDHGPPADVVTWVWCVNAESTADVTLQDYYPGDSMVDWVGVDGFNWGTSQSWSDWQLPEEVFGDAVETVREFTDSPLVIPEVGCSSATDSGDGEHRKAAWIEAAFDFFAAEQVTFVGWFDVDKETDWAICAQPGSGLPGERTLRGREYGVYPAFERAARRYRAARARRD